MIRVSKAQLELLERNLSRGGDEAPPVLRTGRRREDLPENVLERQIRDFLAWHGFITIRQHVGTFIPLRVVKELQSGQITFDRALRNVVSIGEQGAADWWSARPIIPAGGRALDGPHPCATFFWEAKSPGKRPSDAQLEWLAKRRAVGLEATWFNQFQFKDRPAAVVDARESHVFEVWFAGHFDRRAE
jgi:hypothetical protein